MWLIIFSIVLVYCLYITHIYIKDSISKFCLYIYLFYWNISIISSCFHPFGMHSIQDYTYFLLLLGMISFFLGMVTVQRVYRLSPTVNDNINLFISNSALARNPICLFLFTFCTFFLIKFALNTLVAANNQGAGLMDPDLRMKKIFEGKASASLLYMYVIIPLFYSSLCILFVSLFSKRTKRPYLFYILAIPFIIAYSVVAGGRNIFVIILIYLFVTAICIRATRKKLNIPFKWTKYCIVLIFLAMIAMSLQTGYRKTGKYEISEDSIGEQLQEMSELFASYSLIPIKLFDIALEHDVPDELDAFWFGRATIAGTDEVLCGLYRRIIGTQPESSAIITTYVQNTWVPNVLPDTGNLYNYCYTAVFYNYMDFGVLGVIIIPFFMGFIFRYYIYQFYKYRSLPALMLVCFGFFMMVHSLFQCYFVKNWSLVYCVLLAIWQYRISHKAPHKIISIA